MRVIFVQIKFHMEEKTMLKRTMCAVLALVMLICAFPLTALAAETKQETNLGFAAGLTGLSSDASEMNESENNNSRSKADYISYDLTVVNGWVGDSGDDNDYFKITLSKGYYLALLAISGANATNTTRFRVLDKDGNTVKTASYEGAEWNGYDYDDYFSLGCYLSAGTYYIRVTDGQSNVNVQYQFLFQLVPHLATPKVTGSNNASSGKPVLNWGAVSNAAKYRVYRATSQSGEYEYLASTTKTSYTDKTAKAGKSYYYKVKAISGVEDRADGKQSSAVKVVCDCARPAIWLTHRSTTGKNIVKWEEVYGAKEYKVYVATSKTGNYKCIGTTSKLYLVHSSGASNKMYYYKVKAINEKTSAADSAYSVVVGQKTK